MRFRKFFMAIVLAAALMLTGCGGKSEPDENLPGSSMPRSTILMARC